MPARNPVKRGSLVIEQAGRALLAGSFGDDGYPLGGSRAVLRARLVAVHGSGHPWQAGSWSICSLGGVDAWRESGRAWIVSCRAGWPGLACWLLRGCRVPVRRLAGGQACSPGGRSWAGSSLAGTLVDADWAAWIPIGNPVERRCLERPQAGGPETFIGCSG